MRPNSIISAALILSMSALAFAQEYVDSESAGSFYDPLPRSAKITDTTFKSEFGGICRRASITPTSTAATIR